MTGITVPIDLPEMLESIEVDSFTLYYFLSHMVSDNILIIGKSDGYIFDKGKLLYNIEIKTTTKYNLKMIYPSDRIQAVMYIRTLDYLGFDVSDAKVILIKTLRDVDDLPLSKVKESIKNGVFTELMENINENEEIRISIIDYDRNWVDWEIDKLLSLWKGERDPILQMNRKNRCKSCVFSNKCDYSMFRSNIDE
jgi:hypothetical protein